MKHRFTGRLIPVSIYSLLLISLCHFLSCDFQAPRTAGMYTDQKYQAMLSRRQSHLFTSPTPSPAPSEENFRQTARPDEGLNREPARENSPDPTPAAKDVQFLSGPEEPLRRPLEDLHPTKYDGVFPRLQKNTTAASPRTGTITPAAGVVTPEVGAPRKSAKLARKLNRISKQFSPLTLQVSRQLIYELTPLKREIYNGESKIRKLFRSMRAPGDSFCSMYWNKKRFNKKRAARFIRKNRLGAFRRGCRGCLKGLKAGCWNFFIMNDARPDLDFKLVKALYPRINYDCYSVGFMQPYMMHSILGCARLTTLDIDWRIIHAHAEVIGFFRLGQMDSPGNIRVSLQSLGAGWIAYSNYKYSKRSRTDYRLFCGRHGQQKLCLRHLLNFQKRLPEAGSFHLNLSALHEASFTRPKVARFARRSASPETRLTRVVYLSNAMEDIYTKYHQFRQTLKNLRKAMKNGEKTLLIHHVGGHRGFGLYEFKRVAGKSRGVVKTICRDKYINTALGRNQKYYRSHFERLSVNRRYIPSCGGLLRKKGIRG